MYNQEISVFYKDYAFAESAFIFQHISKNKNKETDKFILKVS